MSDETPRDTNHPKYNTALIGHGEAERLFLEAFNDDRLHHAWLISGPKGVGKASFAWRAAKFLLVHGNDPIDSGDSLFGDALPPANYESLSVDTEDDTVARILAGTHGDVREIARSISKDTGKMRKEVVIDDIRKLISYSTQTSSEGGWRIAILDSVDDLNVAASNALLKLLEEPPKRTLLFLVSHSPGKLLPTIRSRCRALQLKTLPSDSVKAVLAAKFPSLSVEDMAALSVLSEGAPGKACYYGANDAISLYRDLVSLKASMPNLDVPHLHKFAEQLAGVKADERYRLFVQLMAFINLRIIRFMATGQAPDPVFAAEASLLNSMAAKSSLDRWMDLWEKTAELMIRTDAVHLERKQVIINIFSQMAVLVSR